MFAAKSFAVHSDKPNATAAAASDDDAASRPGRSYHSYTPFWLKAPMGGIKETHDTSVPLRREGLVFLAPSRSAALFFMSDSLQADKCSKPVPEETPISAFLRSQALPSPSSPLPMDADKVAEAIALEIAKKSKAFVSEKLFEIQRSGQCSFSVRFMDANRAENKADLERAYDVELVKLYFENFKYTVSNVETGGCIFSDCRPHCNFHQNAGKYASMHVSLQQHLKAQVDVVKRQLFPDAFSETAKLATKKQATEVARRPAAAGGDDVVQTAVLPSPDELAVAVATETPEGGYPVGDESGNCIICTNPQIKKIFNITGLCLFTSRLRR